MDTEDVGNLNIVLLVKFLEIISINGISTKNNIYEFSYCKLFDLKMITSCIACFFPFWNECVYCLIFAFYIFFAESTIRILNYSYTLSLTPRGFDLNWDKRIVTLKKRLFWRNISLFKHIVTLDGTVLSAPKYFTIFNQ